MKNIYLFLLLISALLSGYNANSQNRQRFPILRERILKAKLYEIRLNLKLDQATFERFRPVYIKYESEISEIDFRKMTKLMRVEADSLSVDEANQLIVNQLGSARRLIDLREKYYKEFRTIITPQQIIKLYQTEAEMRKKVTQELKRRLMDR